LVLIVTSFTLSFNSFTLRDHFDLAPGVYIVNYKEAKKMIEDDYCQ